eukprot:6483762-Amphidinium_carterae.1
MAFRAVLLVTLLTLCGSTRPVEQERVDLQLEPELDAVMQAEQVSSVNVTEDGRDEFGDKCCCYFPMEGNYKSNPIEGLSVDSCPARGCDRYWGKDRKGRLPGSPTRVCSEDSISKRDIYCK